MQTLLGLDYGRVHLGLAIARTQIVEPLETIPFDQAEETIAKLLKDEQIETIVIGVSEGKMAEETRAYGTELANKLSCQVVFHDETLSSQSASKHLRHASKKKRQGHDHHYAAALILQDYVDFNL